VGRVSTGSEVTPRSRPSPEVGCFAFPEWSEIERSENERRPGMARSNGYETPVLVELGTFFALTSGPRGACVDGFGGYAP